MATIRTKVEAIDRDIDLILSQDLSPAARSKTLADFAQQAIGEAEANNRRILGRDPIKTIYVDGREGGALLSVKPDGEIVAEFDVFSDTLAWIGDQLETHSPKKSGRYSKSHTLFADGREVPLGMAVPLADEYVFLNLLPYSRKIELGQSSQAPDGVYQVVAALARRRFSNVARISFSYRTAMSGAIVTGYAGNKSKGRYPAVIVTMPR